MTAEWGPILSSHVGGWLEVRHMVGAGPLGEAAPRIFHRPPYVPQFELCFPSCASSPVINEHLDVADVSREQLAAAKTVEHRSGRTVCEGGSSARVTGVAHRSGSAVTVVRVTTRAAGVAQVRRLGTGRAQTGEQGRNGRDPRYAAGSSSRGARI